MLLGVIGFSILLSVILDRLMIIRLNKDASEVQE
jgi:hypothetical protein